MLGARAVSEILEKLIAHVDQGCSTLPPDIDLDSMKVAYLLGSEESLEAAIKREDFPAVLEQLSTLLNPDLDSTTDIDKVPSDTLLSLRKTQIAWRRNFIGETYETFVRFIAMQEEKFDPRYVYSRFMPIVQASGAGKSRLIDTHLKNVAGVCYTLRSGGQSGYPPGDTEITDFVLCASHKGQREHATLISLLSVTVVESKCRLF